MLARAVLVLSTASASGLLVGSGVAQLLAPRLDVVRPAPLPHVELVEPEAPDTLTGGLFLPTQDPAPPAPEPAPAPGDVVACEVPWRLVGTMIDRRRPARSFAAFATPEGSRLLAVEMVHAELTVVALDASSATLSRADGRRCQIRMFAPEPAARVVALSVADPTPPADHPLVRQVSASHVELDRRALELGGDALGGVRAVPHLEGGRVAGVRLFGVRAGSPLAATGLRNGDVVRAIDGAPIEGADVALAALGRLRSGERVRVTVASGGEAREVTLALGAPR